LFWLFGSHPNVKSMQNIPFEFEVVLNIDLFRRMWKITQTIAKYLLQSVIYYDIHTSALSTCLGDPKDFGFTVLYLVLPFTSARESNERDFDITHHEAISSSPSQSSLLKVLNLIIFSCLLVILFP
jgi:hypothetical protein